MVTTRIAATTTICLLFSLPALAAVPGPPSALTASVSGNVVSLVWQAASTGVPTGYIVEATLSPGGAAIATVPIAQTALVVPGVPNGCTTCAFGRRMPRARDRHRMRSLQPFQVAVDALLLRGR